MNDREKNLLPQGFYDSLDESAYKEIQLNFSIIEKLNSLGYKLVRPAICEFEEFLDRNFSSGLFKVTDPISGKMMAIRNDITPQISRIVNDRYEQKVRAEDPLRISYTGQILKKTGKGKFQERQLTQTGFELIGGNLSEADKEVLKVVREVYGLIGVNKYTIDFTIPKLSDELFSNYDFDEEQRKTAQMHIEEKNISMLRSDDKLSEIANIIDIYEKASDTDSAVKALDNIINLVKSDKAKGMISELKDIILSLGEQGKVSEFDISLNLLEKAGFDYHTGFCFSIISQNTYEEIGRGGRYKIKSSDKKIDAIGFTFVLNPILRSGINISK